MRETRSNGTRRRVNRDPDRRRTPSPNGFHPLPEGHPLTVCGRCSAVIPDTERARLRHASHHEQLLGLEDGRPA